MTTTATVVATKAVFTERKEVCDVCDARVSISSATTDHEEAPEMLGLPPGCYVGLVHDEYDGEAQIVVACSLACVEKLLSE